MGVAHACALRGARVGWRLDRRDCERDYDRWLGDPASRLGVFGTGNGPARVARYGGVAIHLSLPMEALASPVAIIHSVRPWPPSPSSVAGSSRRPGVHEGEDETVLCSTTHLPAGSRLSD
jgi:hypothetical protein